MLEESKGAHQGKGSKARSWNCGVGGSGILECHPPQGEQMAGCGWGGGVEEEEENGW